MIVYLETSAAAKLIAREAETQALQIFLDDESTHVVSSALLETELRRAASREGIGQELVTDVLDKMELIDVDRAMYSHAGLLPGTHLRSLDALHIAAAMAAGADVIVSYDIRQKRAAGAAGMKTFAPA